MTCRLASNDDSKQVHYFYAIMAKAIQEGDGDQFTRIYDFICPKASAEEVAIAKERAREMADLPSATLLQQIAQLEDEGVETLGFMPGSNKTLNSETILDTGEGQSACANMASEVSFFLDKEILSSEKPSPVAKDGETFENNLKFDTLSKNERSLMELQSRMNVPSNVSVTNENLVKSSELPMSLQDQKHLIIAPENNPAFKTDKSNKKSLSGDLSSHNNKNSVSNDKVRSTPFLCNDSDKDDISTCINFNLFSPNTKVVSTKEDQSSRKTSNAKHEDYLKKEHKSLKSTKRVSPIQDEKNNSTNPQNDSVASKQQPKSDNNTSTKSSTNVSKPKRRTIKEYQKEKLNRMNGTNAETEVEPRTAVTVSKAAQRKQNLQEKLEMLPDVKVNQILIECGEAGVVVEKEQQKKTKSKLKKQKKVAKKQKGKGLIENSKSSTPLELDSHSLDVSGVQSGKPKKEVNRISGRISATHSSMHPSKSDVEPILTSRSRPLIVHPSTSVKEPEWPSITSSATFGDTPGSDNSSVPFPVKFKTTLDSTGCSLASSSEDGSSTSSNASNKCSPSVPELLTLELGSHSDPITSMSATLVDTPLPNVGADEDAITPKTNQAKDDVNDICKNQKLSGEKSSNFVVKSVPDCDKNFADQKQKLKPVSASKCVETDNGNTGNVIRSSKQVSSCDSQLEQKVLSELKNEWGLDFFYEENSNQSREPVCEPVKLTDNDTKLCFGIGDTDLPAQIDKLAKTVNVKSVKKNCSTLFSDKSAPPKKIKINVENFNFSEAATILMQEWNLSVGRGQLYEEALQ